MSQDGPGNGGKRAPVPSAPTEGLPEGLLAPGQVLGDRYQIKSQLGRGGMGEVWRAFDLKLRVEVALKAMLPDLFKDERRRDLLRREVRAAREVVSPNVCRIFDLIEVDGSELVSMEYVDGGTLLDVLQERGPLDLKEAQDIASQFLAGLEAIHQAGLVHRDVKPENIMITRAGRVVLMDFGLARQEDSGAGTVSGTPAYMAPEQAVGGKVDARADVYSAGVVLAEMVSPDGIKDLQSRKSVWEGIRHEPARVPDTPWAPVLKKAVEKEPEQRYNSAHTLTRALEDVTLRVEGAEDLTPYPGLASFTEDDAEYFFGREAEVEAAWRRMEGAHLLAIVGPSGAGKTSFIAAGLVPNAPVGWSIVRCTPGNAAISSLARVMAREMAGDADAMELAVGFDEPDVAVELFSRWRRRHDEALLVVDQFEELFTQNPPDQQARFAELLGRLALESNVRVLLSMRDDFLMECKLHEPLLPLFESLVPLMPPTGANLRRALVQPATKCGYRFEDDEFVDEMLAEVEGERGALPLLAFAMSRLWEKRDRDEGLLTRQAFQDIGGVGGALARHAEVTLDRIGADRVPIVRELLRNLVTAEGTRAVREWDELLSVFENSKRESAEEVLRGLIDARLLTSYEIQEEDQEPARRVEIIHESLLANWPRLVRWQTQDADAVQLRDQLRQAARTWDEHDRSNDFLWADKAYREFVVWREIYPGGLTDLEEDFASAMTSHAKRRKRRRRVAVTTLIAVLVAGLAVVGSFWQRSVREARRAEAANLVSLGQLELESYPSATVAHAIASLEFADNEAARRLALKALWKGPTALVASEDFAQSMRFSPDGRWLVKGRNLFGDSEESELTIYNDDGSSIPLMDVHDRTVSIGLTNVSESGHFASASATTEADSSLKIALWSVTENRPLAETMLQSPQRAMDAVVDSNRKRVVLLIRDNNRIRLDSLGFDGRRKHLGTLPFETRRVESGWTTRANLDHRAGNWLGVVTQEQVFAVEVGDHDLSEARLIGEHKNVRGGSSRDPLGRFMVTAAKDGEFRFWSLTDQKPPLVEKGPPDTLYFDFTPDGLLFFAVHQEEDNGIVWVWDTKGDRPRFQRKINMGGTSWGGFTLDPAGRHIARTGPDTDFRIWGLDAPAAADPVVLQRGDIEQANERAFDPKGSWLATTDLSGLVLWPLAKDYPFIIQRHTGLVDGLVFAPDGSWLASSSNDGTVRIWPLVGDPPPPGLIRYETDAMVHGISVSPDGEKLIAGMVSGNTALIPVNGDPPTTLEGFSGQTWAVAFSPDGSLAAAAGGQFHPGERAIRIWDVATGDEVTVLDFDELPFVEKIQFLSNKHLLSSNESALVRWDIETGERTTLYEGLISLFASSSDGRRILMVEAASDLGNIGQLVLLDTETGNATHLERFGDDVRTVATDPAATVVATGDKDGEVRVGLVDGGEPHLLIGHEGVLYVVDIDPLGRWVASGGTDTSVRIWPMPDLSMPPLHTLPREELIAKLKTLTNLRVVRDQDSASGWKLEVGPFPGWETVPTW